MVAPDLTLLPMGTAAGLTYYVKVDEDFWHGLPAERQEFCKETWIKEASSMDGVGYVVLQLIPDPLFPRTAKEKPYLEWRHDLPDADEPDFTVLARLSVVVRTETKFVDPVMRAQITTAMQMYPVGTPYCITNSLGDELERGDR